MEDLNTIKVLIEKGLSEIGYDLYSLKYLPRGKTLEIVVDRLEPINLDDITLVSETISKILDEHDFTEDSYTLDVSSLGIEKPIELSKLHLYQGKYVNVHLSDPFKGMNTLEGTLSFIDDENVTIIYKDKTRDVKCDIKRKSIDKARLAIKF